MYDSSMTTSLNDSPSKTASILAEQEAALKALSIEEQELMAPITPRLQAIVQERAALANRVSESIAQSLESVTLEDLSDPVRALEIYEGFWNGGMGVRGGRKMYVNIFEGSYVCDSETRSLGLSDTTFEVPTIAIPKVKDEEKLKITAEMLAPIYFALLEIAEKNQIVGIPILEDNLGEAGSFSIVYEVEDSKWKLLGNWGSEIFASSELIEVLRKVPTYQ